MSQPPSSRKKWLLRLVKLLILAAVLWWVHDTLTEGYAELRRREQGRWGWQPGWLAIAGGIYLLGLLPFGLFWHRVLLTFGQRPRLGQSLRAYYIGHLGKYVPGKAMVVLIRAGLIRSHRVGVAVAAVSVFLETLTMMAVGACAAAAYLVFFFRQQWSWSCAAAALMAVSLAPTLPPVFRRLVRLLRVAKADPRAADQLERFGFATLLTGWLLSLVGWAGLGLSYWATLRGLGVQGMAPIGDLPRYVAGVALAVVAGFLLLVLPAGVGVREAFLAKLMIPYLDGLGHAQSNAIAWASAFLLRLVWTVSELIISGIMYFLGLLSPERVEVDP